MAVAERAGRVVLDAQTRVVEADPVCHAILAVPTAEGAPGLERRLSALGLLPVASELGTSFRKTTRPGEPPRTLEAVIAPAPRGWVIALRDTPAGTLGLVAPEDQANFLAIFAHELRTPLTALKTSLQVLRRRMKEAPERDRTMLETSVRSVLRLEGAITEVIDATALVAGEMELALDDVDLAAVVKEAAASVGKRTGRKDVRVVPSAFPLPAVRADRARVLQVLTELLDNAAKCSEPGSGIEVGTRRVGGSVVVDVADRGKGIPPERRSAIFRPFYQLDRSLTRDVQGLGLGLAICKGIVELHGGTIQVDGDAGAGSTFTFTLPAAHSAGQ